MQLKYVVKRRGEKGSDTTNCTLKCGKLELAKFDVTANRTTLASGKIKSGYTVRGLGSHFIFKFEPVILKQFKNAEDAIAAVKKVIDTQLSKLETA